MNYIKGFDGLRAFSIGFVLLSHLGLHDYFFYNEFYRTRVFNLYSGNTGVLIFFTISGFLISKILLNQRTSNNSISFKNFYIRRFLRLLPALIIFYVMIGILMKLELIPRSKYGFLFSVFYIYNFVPNKFYTFELGHTWSLALEEQFYFIWPFIISYLSKFKTLLLAISVLLVCVFTRFYIPASIITDHNSFMYSRWFIPAIAPVMIGSTFAILIHYYNAIISPFFKKKNIILFIAMFLFISPLYMLRILFPVCSIFQSIGVALLLLWILYNQETQLTKMLEFKPLRYIGKISYGIYVFQGLFLRTGPGGDLFVQKFPINIILTLICAIISFELIETKVMRLKRHFK